MDPVEAAKRIMGVGLFIAGVAMFRLCFSVFYIDAPPIHMFVLSGVCTIAGLVFLWWAYKPTHKI